MFLQSAGDGAILKIDDSIQLGDMTVTEGSSPTTPTSTARVIKKISKIE